jgi:hypothetical protein
MSSGVDYPPTPVSYDIGTPGAPPLPLTVRVTNINQNTAINGNASVPPLPGPIPR